MTESEEILKQAREKLAELLEKDDPLLARQAKLLHSADDLQQFSMMLRYLESYHYPCCHAAYKYAVEAYAKLIEAILAEAGFDTRSREGRLPIPP
jgi:hypothetical protein